MGVQVTFDPAGFYARYPEFQDIDEGLLQQFFDEATVYHRNDGGGPVSTAAVQTVLLNMLVAHIAKRYATVNGQEASTLVGRISNASEGSVSVGVDFPQASGFSAWLLQTKYGADYWAATAPYRKFRFVPGPRRVFNPWPIGGRIFW